MKCLRISETWAVIATQMLCEKVDVYDPENYPLIALVNNIFKLMILILYNRCVICWVERNNKILE